MEKRKMNIKDIIITKRIRKDLGDINALVKSIQDIGLLHPIIINEKNELICGRRRLEALRTLGIIDLEENKHFRIFNIQDTLKGEFEENFCRKDFTPSEAVEIWDATESHQGQPRAESARSQRRNKVAKSLGVGKDWLREAKAVKDSGREDLVEQMDSGDLSVHKAYEQVMKNRVPDPLYLSPHNVELSIKEKKTTATRDYLFGNWLTGDIISIHKLELDVLKVKITSIITKRLSEITEEDAKAEGFKSLKEFKKYWEDSHGHWIPDDKVKILKYEIINE